MRHRRRGNKSQLAGDKTAGSRKLRVNQQGTHTMQSFASDSADDTLRLAAVLDLAAAPDFLASLRSSLVADCPLCLDASAVELLTLPCAQIILSATQTYDRLTIMNPSAAFVGAFDDLGLSLPEGCEVVQTANPHANHHDVPEISTGEPADDSRGVVDSQTQDEPAADGQSDHADPEQAVVHDRVAEFANAFETDQTDAQPMTKRILTIDDSKTMRDMLLLTLTDAGFEVLQGIDGQDGLDVLGEQRVDVIITDINMPRMDGYEVIRQLRSNPHHKTTPILVLTTESDTEKKSLARNAGATGWMVKPFDPEGLVAVINKVSP
jgi:two-component system chemotaxis response regulator CheY